MKNSSNSRYGDQTSATASDKTRKSFARPEASVPPRSPYERLDPGYAWPESERQKAIQQYRESWRNRPREKPPGPIGDGWIQPVVVTLLIGVLVAILYAIASM